MLLDESVTDCVRVLVGGGADLETAGAALETGGGIRCPHSKHFINAGFIAAPQAEQTRRVVAVIMGTLCF